MASRRELSGAQVIETMNKTLNLGAAGQGFAAQEFCTGNDSKALALCAARSHIVAVR
jgi:hypothetical protein